MNDQTDDPVTDFGSFQLYQTNLFYENNLIVYRIEHTAKVSTTERAKLTVEQQAELDDYLFKLRVSGITINYTKSWETEFDYQNQFDQFVSNANVSNNIIFSKQYGLDLNEQELNFAIVYAQAKADFDLLNGQVKDKFKGKFSKPTIPYKLLFNSDKIEKIFGVHYAEALEWINNTNLNNTTLESFAKQSPGDRNLVRITSNVKKVQSLTGYTCGIKTAKRIVTYALEQWKCWDSARTYADSDFSVQVSGYSGKYIRVTNDYIKIGCQEIPRYEVERIATLLNVNV